MSDEIDFDGLRLPPNAQLIAIKDYSIIPVRKPKKTEWIRVHPGDDWRIDLAIYEEEAGETYLVGRDYFGYLNELKLVKLARIFTVLVYGSGVLFLSPIGLPDVDGKINSYNRSRAEAYLKAETEWVRISANKDLGGYDCWTPEAPMQEPEWPSPPHSLKEMLNIAFKDRYINAPDHPIIKQLRGKL
jgi:hypothetical protein